MELIAKLVDVFIHLNRYLSMIVEDYGPWTYVLLFLVIFAETGLVVTPFLPGDSLLFAVGALAAGGALDVSLLFLLLAFAAVIGDTVNYWIGHRVGLRAFQENIRFLRRDHLERTQRFYEHHGGKTIVLARFIPIVRTFAPFVAGIGSMSYGRFVTYNILGGIAWTGGFLFIGYYFGNIPEVKHNFSFAILAIIVISIVPAVIEYLRHRPRAEQVANPDGGT
ncbi:MAG: DedA family protein [Candidatus Latescibacteria bacterium]|nr:DedA family protein [Candidatus Latescibacterota bacterium]